MPHKPTTRLRLEAGEIIFADVCGVYNRYHADLCRFLCLGQPEQKTVDRMKALAESIPYVQGKVKVGDPPTAIGRAIDEYLASIGLTGEVDRGGYDVGLSLPPDWVGHTRVVGGGFVDEPMQPGFVTNYEIFSRGKDPRSAGLIDTFVMTESGLELLSKLPLEILSKAG